MIGGLASASRIRRRRSSSAATSFSSSAGQGAHLARLTAIANANKQALGTNNNNNDDGDEDEAEADDDIYHDCDDQDDLANKSNTSAVPDATTPALNSPSPLITTTQLMSSNRRASVRTMGRRRAVNASDHKTCVLLHSKLKGMQLQDSALVTLEHESNIANYKQKRDSLYPNTESDSKSIRFASNNALSTASCNDLEQNDYLEQTHANTTSIDHQDLNHLDQNYQDPNQINNSNSNSNCTNINDIHKSIINSSLARRKLLATGSKILDMIDGQSGRRNKNNTSLFLFDEQNLIRRKARKITESALFEWTVLATIIANCVALAMEEHLPANDKTLLTQQIESSEFYFLCVFCAEALLKIFALGFVLHEGSYLRNIWNIIDFVVVSTGFVAVIVNENSRFFAGIDLRTLRAMRVLRPLKLVSGVSSLQVVLKSIVKAMAPLLQIGLLVLFAIVIFAIIGLEFYAGALHSTCYSKIDSSIIITEGTANDNPTPCFMRQTQDSSPSLVASQFVSAPSGAYLCAENYSICLDTWSGPNYGITSFDDIYFAMLTVFQCITMEGWTSILYWTNDALGSRWNWMYFVPLIIFGSFFMLNLVLGVLSGEFAKERERVENRQAFLKMRRQQQMDRELDGYVHWICKAEEVILKEERTSKEQKLYILRSRRRIAKKLKRKRALAAKKRYTNSFSVILAANQHQSIETQNNDHQDDHNNNNNNNNNNNDDDDDDDDDDDEDDDDDGDDNDEDEDDEAFHADLLEYDHTNDVQVYINSFGETVKTPRLRLKRPHATTKATKQPKSKSFMSCKSLGALERKFKANVKHIIKSQVFYWTVIVLVFLNTLCVAVEHYGQPDWLTEFLFYAELVFLALFVLEMTLKMYALTVKIYFESAFNKFDFTVVMGSVFEVFWSYYKEGSFGLSVLRALRLLRIFKVTKYWSSLRNLVISLLASMRSIISLLFLLFLFLLTFALLGMQLFGGQFNFDTGEDWNEVMYNGIRSQGGIERGGMMYSVYFIVLVLFGNYTLLNVFLAIAVDNLANAQEMTAVQEVEADEMRLAAKDELEKELASLRVNPNNEQSVGLGGKTAAQISSSLSQHRDTLEANDTFGSIIRVEISAPSPPLNESFDTQESHNNNQQQAKLSTAPTSNQVKANNQLSFASSNSNDAYFDDLDEYEAELERQRAPKAILPYSSMFILSSDNSFRRWTHWLVNTRIFEPFIMSIIVLSSVALAAEDPINDHSDWNELLNYFDYAFTVVFTIEMVLKIVDLGVFMHEGSYGRDAWNLLDAIVVIFALIACTFSVGSAGQNLSTIKAFRVLRVLRPLKTIKRVPKLKAVFECVLTSLRNVFNILIVYMLFQFIFAVIAVQLFNGRFFYCTNEQKLTADECHGDAIRFESVERVSSSASLSTMSQAQLAHPSGYGTNGVSLYKVTWLRHNFNYDDVLAAILTLFTVQTGEGWPSVLQHSVDSTLKDLGPLPKYRLEMSLFYVVFFIVFPFFFVNIFVALIIITFQEQGEKELEEGEIDKNQKSCIDFALNSKPLQRYMPKDKDSFKYTVWRLVVSSVFEYTIMVLIVCNTILLMMKSSRNTEADKSLLKYLNHTFTLLFALECLLKICAFGLRNFFRNYWNTFDCVTVVGSAIDAFIVEFGGKKNQLQVGFLRLFRAARLIKLLRQGYTIRILLWTFIQSFKALPYVCLLIGMLFFIYAIIGMQVFGDIAFSADSQITRHNNFRNFVNGLLLLFRCATGEAWQQVMMACVEGQWCDSRSSKGAKNCGSNVAYIYFVSFIFLCSFLMLNLFVAVIMDNFDYLTRDSSILGAHHLDEFIRVWAEYDPNATGYIHFNEMYDMLRNMAPPLGFGNKCPQRLAYKKLIRMNMPVNESNGKVNFTTTFFALIRENLNIRMRTFDEMDQADRELRLTLLKMWPIQAKRLMNKLLPPKSQLGPFKLTVGKIYVGMMILESWRNNRFGRQRYNFNTFAQLTNLTRQSATNSSFVANDSGAPDESSLFMGSNLFAKLFGVVRSSGGEGSTSAGAGSTGSRRASLGDDELPPDVAAQLTSQMSYAGRRRSSASVRYNNMGAAAALAARRRASKPNNQQQPRMLRDSSPNVAGSLGSAAACSDIKSSEVAFNPKLSPQALITTFDAGSTTTSVSNTEQQSNSPSCSQGQGQGPGLGQGLGPGPGPGQTQSQANSNATKEMLAEAVSEAIEFVREGSFKRNKLRSMTRRRARHHHALQATAAAATLARPIRLQHQQQVARCVQAQKQAKNSSPKQNKQFLHVASVATDESLAESRAVSSSAKLAQAALYSSDGQSHLTGPIRSSLVVANEDNHQFGSSSSQRRFSRQLPALPAAHNASLFVAQPDAPTASSIPQLGHVQCDQRLVRRPHVGLSPNSRMGVATKNNDKGHWL